MTGIEFAYDIFALLGVVLIMYVMQKTEHDRINQIDPPRLQWSRRLAFVSGALALCYSILSTDWERSLPMVLLIASADAILGVNALALHIRNAPPMGGYKARNAMQAKKSRY